MIIHKYVIEFEIVKKSEVFRFIMKEMFYKCIKFNHSLKFLSILRN